MKISIRQSELIHFILNEPFSSVSKISRVLNLAEKTVRKEVNSVNQYLHTFESEIRQNIRKELYVHTPHSITWWRNTNAENVTYPMVDLVKLYILMQSDTVTVQSLADVFFYTKTMMEKIVYSKQFDDFGIIRRRNFGMYFSGTDQERYDAISYIFDKYVSYANFIRVIPTFIMQLPNTHLKKEDFKQCTKLLNTYVNQTNVYYTDKAIKKLYSTLLLMISDSRMGKIPLQKNKSLSEEVKSFLSIYNQFFTELIDEEFLERVFISLRQYVIQLLNESDSDEIKRIRRQIQKEVSEKLSIDLSDTHSTIIQKLDDHIFQTIKRISTENFSVARHVNDEYKVMMNDFRTSYPLPYEAGRIALSVLEEVLDKKGNDIEIVYLGIYFQLMIVKQQKRFESSVLLICEHGFGIINFLKDTIQRKIPYLTHIETVSAFQFMNNRSDYEKFDLYISTVADLYVDEADVSKMVTISSIITETDIQRIKEKNNQRIFNQIIQNTDDNLVLANQTFQTKEEILQTIIEHLKRKGLVLAEYEQSVFEREQMAPTDFNNIAIPHGDPTFVQKNSYVIITLNQPVLWNEHRISVVAMFVVTAEDLLQFRESVAIFYEQFASVHYISALINAQNKTEIQNILLGGY